MIYKIKINKENKEQIRKTLNTPQMPKSFLNDCIQTSKKLKKETDKNE